MGACDHMVFVTGIGRGTAQRLLDQSAADVAHFSPGYMQKVIDSCPNDIICGLFRDRDRRNALAMLSVTPGHGPCAYVHELVGFRKGFGERILRDAASAFGPIWLMCTLDPTGDASGGPKFRPNVRLRDRFYRRIPWLREYVCTGTRWFCDVSFFYSEGAGEDELTNFIDANYKRERI